MAIVAQLVRASGCGPEGRGFESHRSPQFSLLTMEPLGHYVDVDDLARESLLQTPQTREDFEADYAKQLQKTQEQQRRDAKHLLQ